MHKIDIKTFLDSIVFGGNCLHNFNVEKQLEVDRLEKVTDTDKKYRLGGFVKLHWYAAKNLSKQLTDANRRSLQKKREVNFPQIYIQALEQLRDFLEKNNPNTSRKRDEKDERIRNIPHDISFVRLLKSIR